VNRHLNDRELLAHLEGTASPRRSERAEAHLRTCPACHARLERLARTVANVSGTLKAVGEQIPTEPDRSWEAIASVLSPSKGAIPMARLTRRGDHAPTDQQLYTRLRHLATLAVLTLLVVGLAGLIHTLAITGPALTRATPTPCPTPPASPSSAPGPLPRPRPGSVAASTSVLILGTDGESQKPSETDALMILHLDAEAQRAFLLSIPRSLYVDVPGHEQAPAGSIYGLGERDEDTSGLALARDAISTNLGVPIQHAVLVRFDSFIALVDAIGGVDVEVPHPIDDLTFPDDHGGYDPLLVSAGVQHFDGAVALRYARTRVVPTPGFDRTFRQQQLLLAMHERVTRLELLPELIARAPDLWSTVADGLDTDLLLSDLIDLALSATEVTADNITTATLEECCVIPYTTPAGQQGLLPQQDKIESLMEDLLEGEQ